MDAEQVSVERGATDTAGKTDKTAVNPVKGVFSWGSGSRSTGRYSTASETRAESAAISPQFYVAADADLQARDRIKRANGEKYRVSGRALWDADFGYDWGVKVFQLESTNG
ncbi:hypothetical protein AN911_00760 [Mycobacteroides immunogenum]|uniref:Head-tail adaptor protein n=1 Tax=Mycobacteroides immunogenum TaxID=83262 RepID=A0A7V8LSA4_9MYCO|nr:hypothetical protein AN909_05675 [Mycobacteroides immunogenum]KPG14749.1 hypothetical protein AN908_06725 [Mycobacteroides immunogenum]KPG14756.1 hypothetical protein AN908_07235 [Mycobacteroides immunogenum]KPG17619.1 hypothetical protein AN910_04900 [Mycobacteroides immunogenum]KPG24855.1 hypothetical protein AN911_00255 [Mycobacteroides immunogenum]